MSVLITEKKDGVLFITLNRPEVFNSFNREMSLTLQEELNSAHSDTDIRCIVLTGAGKAFCAGQDLNEAIDDSGPGISRIVKEHYNPIITAIINNSKPVIAVVNGVAAGAGANIALACDIVLASSSASFIQAFSKIGLIPDSGGTYTLPRLIGRQRASYLMMTGDKLNAAEALQMGLVSKIFEPEELQNKCYEFAKNLAGMPTMALSFTKHLINISYQNNLEEQLNMEAEFQVKSASTYDYKEGVNSFLEKRKPVFKGM